jgi:hypothetical protein
MKPATKFTIQIVGTSIVFGGLIQALGFASDPLVVKSIGYAWLVMMVNTLLGFAAFQYAFEKDNTTFYKVVFGGLAARMLLSMVVIAAIILLSNTIRLLEFILSLFIFYAAFVTIEILFYVRQAKMKKQSEKTFSQLNTN